MPTNPSRDRNGLTALADRRARISADQEDLSIVGHHVDARLEPRERRERADQLLLSADPQPRAVVPNLCVSIGVPKRQRAQTPVGVDHQCLRQVGVGALFIRVDRRVAVVRVFERLLHPILIVDRDGKLLSLHDVDFLLQLGEPCLEGLDPAELFVQQLLQRRLLRRWRLLRTGCDRRQDVADHEHERPERLHVRNLQCIPLSQ